MKIFDILQSDCLSLKKHIQIQFHKNMEFFRSFNTKLFNALSLAPSEYNLVLDEKNIDILNLKTNKTIYNNHLISSHYNLALHPAMNDKYSLYLNLHQHILNNFIDENKLSITGKIYNDILKNDFSHEWLDRINVIDSIKQGFENNKFLPCTAFIGLFSGIFLQGLLESGYSFFSLIIYEENIDLFRISLYFLDFELLFNSVQKNNCFLMIKDINFDIISSILQNKRLLNNFAMLELKQLSSNGANSLQEFLSHERRIAFRGWGSFEDEVIGLKNSIVNLKSCKILKNPKKINAPILVIGSGASLDLNIDFIKKNKDKMIIFSAGTALKILINHNITPDFQIEIERVPYLKDVLQHAGFKDIALIYSSVLNLDAINLAKEKFCFMRNANASSFLDQCLQIVEFSSPFVGNAALSLALLMGSDVIMCALDCAIISGLKKHANNSYYGDESSDIPKDYFEIQPAQDEININGKIVKNYKIYSNDLFMLSLKNLQNAIKFYHSNCVINIGYGAFIDGAKNIKSTDFDLKKINKSKALKDLKSNFVDYSYKNTFEYKHIIEEFLHDLKSIDSNCSAIELDIQDIYIFLDKIDEVLKKYVAKLEYRKVSILFEGSILHLSFSILLSSFYRRKKYDRQEVIYFLSLFFDKMQEVLKDIH